MCLEDRQTQEPLPLHPVEQTKLTVTNLKTFFSSKSASRQLVGIVSANIRTIDNHRVKHGKAVSLTVKSVMKKPI